MSKRQWTGLRVVLGLVLVLVSFSFSSEGAWWDMLDIAMAAVGAMLITNGFGLFGLWRKIR